MKKTFSQIALALVLSGFSSFISGQSVTWTEVAPGVWKTVVGTPDKLDLLMQPELNRQQRPW